MGLDPAKLDKIVGDDKEAGERVKKILLNVKDRYKIVIVGDEEVKIRPTIPKSLRHDLEQIQKHDYSTLDDVESAMYNLISQMCIESPFNDKCTWEIIDDETGIAMEVLTDIYNTALSTEAEIKRFR
jgi:hypothetical protein